MLLQLGCGVRHARRLDQAYHPGTHPIQDRLEQFGQTRALVIGSYSECSPDVDSLAVASARAWAARNWQEYGSRSEAECYSFIITAYRRQIGVYAAREMARHRLVRIPYIGVPHAALGRRTRRGDPGLGGGGYREHAIGAEAADVPTSPATRRWWGGTASTSSRHEVAAWRGAGGELAAGVSV